MERRGVGPDRLDGVRGQPDGRAAVRHRPLPELRHGRLAELLPGRLRRHGQPRHRRASIPEGSAQIETLFNLHFASKRLPYEDTEFSGRSDYQAFINNDIPAGGLFTGAEVEKTAAQVRRYGGLADVAFDPCYHEACDSFSPLADGGDAEVYAALQKAYGSRLVGNVNTFALDTSADAIAHAVATYSYSTQTVNGEEPPLRGRGNQRAQVVGTEEADAA